MTDSVERHILYFGGDATVHHRTERLDPPGPSEVLVETMYSAISAGTELLVYHGNLPDKVAEESDLDSFQRSSSYPMPHGYSTVGRVRRIGENVASEWRGRRVFGFHPHASAYCTSPEKLIPLSDEVASRAGLFIPNLETAFNLVMDGRPLIGERVVVFGLGVVGLLTTRLLSQHPLNQLVVFDRKENRRQVACRLGADVATPGSEIDRWRVLNNSDQVSTEGADLVYELTGNPEVLNAAIEVCGYDSRIVVGSWYGSKTAEVKLGGRFHRRRMSIISSQVSTISPQLRGRWSKGRRLQSVINQLSSVPWEDLITHEYAIEDAHKAYDSLTSEKPGIQYIFKY